MLRDFLGGNSTVVRPNVSRLHLESAYSVCEEKSTSGAERRMSPRGVTDEQQHRRVARTQAARVCSAHVCVGQRQVWGRVLLRMTGETMEVGLSRLYKSSYANLKHLEFT